MSNDHPHVIVIAGPNGSGKSTAAPILLHEYLQLTDFVNADVIAQGLSAYGAESVAFKAGRIMLERLKELADSRADFAFETTLAAKSFGLWLVQLQEKGYQVHLIFLWLPNAEFAIARVADRVQGGGHHVQDDIVRRRYAAGIRNFVSLYRPIADTWSVFDNSGVAGYDLIADENEADGLRVINESVWAGILRGDS